VSRPSIVPIALTLDDRTGYTLWAPPWEEDGEEWQAFLGSTVDLPADDDSEAPGPTAVVHLFPSPAALAAFCRTNTDHDLADHPVWPVVAELGAADLTPDEDHRFDLDGVYDVVAENPDRWAVDELAATFDIVGRLAECCDAAGDDEDDAEDDDETAFEATAELLSRAEVGALRLGIEAFLGRDGEESWVRLGTAVDELWEDVLEELDEHLDWTGAGRVEVADYPSAAQEAEARAAEADDLDDADEDDAVVDDEDSPLGPASGATAAAPAVEDTPGIRTIRSGSRITASPAAVTAAQEFWEAVGILPVEVVVPEGAGLTLRCYVEDRARFLGRDGQVFVFPTPVELARFCAGDEAHDLTEIASWPEVADTDVLPLPADQDRYDLVEIAEVLAEVEAGAGGLAELRALLQPVEGALDLAEYANLPRVQRHLAAGSPLGRAVARGESDPRAPLAAEEAPALASAWREIVEDIGTALVFRSDVVR
jgi:hypothetical protein